MISEYKTDVFSGELGEKLYNLASSAVEDYSMQEKIRYGILVGFSGGADSVFLLEFLLEYRKRSQKDFSIVAVHVNHGIRGEEADRDELFSRDYATKRGVEFLSFSIDAPIIAKSRGIGLEEASRILRYEIFEKILEERNDISAVAVAHNASDNLETVIFNMMRGAGTKGISGILPVRENIIRPLIYIPKNEIVTFLESVGIDFVTDSTNFSSDYTRNYIRNEIVPLLKRLNPEPEKAATRLSENLRCDNDFIELFAEDFLRKNMENGAVLTPKLAQLHPALFARVILLMAENAGITALQSIHFKSIYKLISGGNFKISLPGGAEFVSESGFSKISFPNQTSEFIYKITPGENYFSDFDSLIILSDRKIDNSFSNVYKISIQARLPFDIINNELFVRSRKEGDSYRFGGMTRRLKKLFNDKNVPPSKRNQVPVFFDESGILWVPGFPPKDSEKSAFSYLAICERIEKNISQANTFYIPNKHN